MSFDEHDIGFQKKLAAESDAWFKEGIITSEQKKQILARYSILKEAGEKAGQGRFITTISILGSILIGIGVILFIASSWSQIPKWTKLFIIFSSMLTAYGIGFYLRYEKKNYPKVGTSLMLLGTFIFGAGIFLIAQIYHITVHFPNGPLMWALGVFPLAYLLRLKTILSLAIINLLLWLGMESDFWIAQPEILPLVFITLYLLAGISLWMTGLMHSVIKPLKIISSPYIVFGIIITFSSGYILTFKVFSERLGSEGLSVFYAAISGIFLISSLVYVLSKNKPKAWHMEAGFLLASIAAGLYLCLFFKEYPDAASHEGSINLITAISNIFFALGVLGIIYMGYLRQYPPYVNMGLVFFVLDVVARYFDFFWKLLPRSIFFMAGGALLLFGGILLERKRRKVLASFNVRETD